MKISKNGRLIYVHRWSLGSRQRAENQQITNKCAENKPVTKGCAENYQPITNEWSLGTRGCTEHYFVETIFVENNADVVVRQKQHGRLNNTTHLASRQSRQDLLFTFFYYFKKYLAVY